MPLKVETETRRQKLRLRHLISLASLTLAIMALILALRKPQPVTVPQPVEVRSANAAAFQSKVEQLASPSSEADQEVHLTAPEIAAAIAESVRTLPAEESENTGKSRAPSISDDRGATPNIGEPAVTFEGDLVKGQFASELGGKKVYITLSGHLGAKDGYATFDPTEFKVGDLKVPVSLVNDALQKRMMEQRERLKLPDFVSDLKVENGELVVKRK
jgi:hypothetical protein